MRLSTEKPILVLSKDGVNQFNHCTKTEEILNGKLHFLCSELDHGQLRKWKNRQLKA